ncbi:MAG: pyridoxamine 5'-phosphate oxidase [Alphaproteobacteria bacterium]|nr:pyridoxamine 5'-phosphate oxidase [Alphaproteobacteria bacterium]
MNDTPAHAPEAEIAQVDDPIRLFETWFEEARKKEPNDAEAMSLATVDDKGMPDVRMVLLKGVDRNGFVFYTNFESAKGQELLGQPKAALCFHWKSLRRQIRVRGDVSVVTDAEADAYFASRPKDSQIGAWASRQSRALRGRFELEKEVARFAAKYALGKVPRPPHWSGFRIAPLQIEFWRDRPFRLHDRLVYRRASPSEQWTTERLFP